MPFEFANWRTVEESGIIMEGPCLLYSVAAVGRDSGDWGDLYDGLDPVSGNHIVGIVGRVEDTFQLSWDHPLYINRGLYLTVTNDMTGLIVSYREIDDDPFKLERGD